MNPRALFRPIKIAHDGERGIDVGLGGRAVRVARGVAVTRRPGRRHRLPRQRLLRSIGIGCGLKPLTLEELAKLGESLLPAELSKLPEEIERLAGLPKGTIPPPKPLPPLPPLSAFPTVFLPPLPSALRLPPPPPARSAHHAKENLSE